MQFGAAACFSLFFFLKRAIQCVRHPFKGRYLFLKIQRRLLAKRLRSDWSSQKEGSASRLSVEVEILLSFFQPRATQSSNLCAISVTSPQERFALAAALAADCRVVIHQLVSGERATAATYGRAEIGAVLMMSLRFLEVRLLVLFPSDYGADKYIDPGRPRCE